MPAGDRPVLLVVAAALVVVAGGLFGWWLSHRGGSSRTTGPEAAAAFSSAYRRSLEGTYHVEGEFTRTLADGRTLHSAFLVAQQPPDRIQRLLGSTTGTLGGKEINCGAPAGGGGYQCAPGAPAPSWDDRVAGRMATLGELPRGDRPAVPGDRRGGRVLHPDPHPGRARRELRAARPLLLRCLDGRGPPLRAAP